MRARGSDADRAERPGRLLRSCGAAGSGAWHAHEQGQHLPDLLDDQAHDFGCRHEADLQGLATITLPT